MSNSANPKALATPGIPASRAKVTLFASTFANARAALCFAKLCDTSVWRDWNHLVPDVTIRSHPSEDEWETPFVSRNPSMAPVPALPSQNQPTSRLGSISEVKLGRDLSLGVPPNYSLPDTSLLDPPLGSKVGTGNHLAVHDPLEGRRSLNKSAQRARILSILTLRGEPSVRLRLGTAMTFHVVLDPSKPEKYRKAELVVSELIRPRDQPAGQKQSYWIMWESASNRTFPRSLPKWLLFCQRVTEIRPVIRGDGREDCEITMWECQRGLLARLVRSYYQEYLQRMFEQNVQGLKGYCEAMGGAVDRRDFSISD